MVKKMKAAMLIAAITTAMASCQKIEELPVVSETKEMLTFASAKEYDETLEKVGKMSDAEFAQWEKENGVTSFYTQAQKAYAELERMQSQEEIFAHVEKNAEFLQLIEDGEDYILETTLSNHSSLEKRILNGNKMVQIGDEVYKVFESGVGQTQTESKHELLKMNEKDFCNSPKNSSVKRIVNESSQRKDIFAKAHTARKDSDNKKERIYLGIEIKWRVPVNAGNYSSNYAIEYTLRPYTKKAGVWFWCQRNISGSIKARARYYNEDDKAYGYVSFNKSISEYSRVSEGTAKVSVDGITNGGDLLFYGLTWESIDCWGRQDKVQQTAEIKL